MSIRFDGRANYEMKIEASAVRPYDFCRDALELVDAFHYRLDLQINF